MHTYYRIDEFNAGHNNSRIFFAKTKTEALSYVKGMKRVTANQTAGREHTNITSFKATTCDMQGWNQANLNDTETVSYL